MPFGLARDCPFLNMPLLETFGEQKNDIECTPRYLLEDSCLTFVFTLSLCNDYDKGGSRDHHMISDLVLRSELIFTFDIFSEWL